MRTIETNGQVDESGKLTAQIPKDVPAGEHRVVLVIDAPDIPQPQKKRTLRDFPVRSWGAPWPEDWTLRREDMYGEWGR